MRSIIPALAAMGLLAGCGGQPRITGANPSSVMVFHDGDMTGSYELAAAHCETYGKDAKLIHSEGWLLSFECVQRQQ